MHKSYDHTFYISSFYVPPLKDFLFPIATKKSANGIENKKTIEELKILSLKQMQPKPYRMYMPTIFKNLKRFEITINGTYAKNRANSIVM